MDVMGTRNTDRKQAGWPTRHQVMGVYVRAQGMCRGQGTQGYAPASPGLARSAGRRQAVPLQQMLASLRWVEWVVLEYPQQNT
jgi:hypothetical protein